MKTNPYNRMAITVVWLVASGFIVIGLMNLGLYWFKARHDHAALNIWRALWLALPLFVGIGIGIKSSALAQWVDEFLDN